MEDKKKIFFCYAHEDEKLRDELAKQLSILQRQGLINFWHDSNISPGMEWEREIATHLDAAHIILLLVSSDFMHSDYCYSKEMKRAMERHEAEEVRVIPVILRPVFWKRAPFGKLKALPKDGNPVISDHWRNIDEAFLDVVKGILKAVEELNRSLLADPATSQPAENNAGKRSSEHFDVCLSYSAADAVWAEHLAERLRDEKGFRVHLNKWVLLSGQSWQQAGPDRIDQTSCCVVCIGELTPISWFKQEIQRALDRQSKEPSFRVIPVLLPNVKTVNVHDFPKLGVWVDFRGADQAYPFYLLGCGVKSVPPGRWPPKRTGGHKGK